MSDRLTPLDASFLDLERTATPMHVGTVMVFDPPDEAFDLEGLTALVSSRIGGVTRYRQRVRRLPGRGLGAVWVDDASFDIGYHVRRAALPRPGTVEQLAEFVARVQSRPLDRAHPLWEVYLVEGLVGGRFAIVTKAHQTLVDGLHAVDIGALILDESPECEPVTAVDVPAGREPSDIELLVRTAWESLGGPGRVMGTVRAGLRDVRGTAGRLGGRALDVAGALARTATDPAPTSPLNAEVGQARRVSFVRADLEDFRRVRDAVGAEAGVDVTVHDVVLATVAGGLRSWLEGRGEPVHTATRVRALVPIGVDEDADSAVPRTGESGRRLGSVSQVVACLVDLPVGEPAARVRLEGIAFQMRGRTSGGGALAAASMASMGGFATSTLHHLGARLGAATTRRLFNLVVTNVPGPQRPLYAGGARLAGSYPIMPLRAGQALAIGLTSYDGLMCIGLAADRAAMGDLDLLGEALRDELAGLVAEFVPDEETDPRPTATSRKDRR